MLINFTKMHGIGNDYIYVDCTGSELPEPGTIAIEMSPRHFSVGSDGLIMVCSSAVADARMRMFNADGSEGKMCGNGIRCVGKFLYDKGLVRKTSLTIETLGGIKQLELTIGEDGLVSHVRVDMGVAVLEPAKIPVSLPGSRVVLQPIEVDGQAVPITCVSMGNPHAVFFTEGIDKLKLEEIGPKYENHSAFPERVNTEFVEVLGKNKLKMRVWERGSGETYACGTGACASVVAAALTGKCDFDVPVTVSLIGGELSIICTKELRVQMTGSATTVYDGVYNYKHGGKEE